jgi:membrane AbrB-like protein
MASGSPVVDSGMPASLAWSLLLIATAAGAALVGLAGVPGPALFAGLLIGIAWALAVRRSRLDVPRPAFAAAQAVIGVQIGLYLQIDTLRAVSADWLPVLVVSLATLGATLLAGLALARITSLDAPTASLGMVAGGASGIVAISRELGADDRLVAVMQYLRLLVIVTLTPLLASVAFGASTSGGSLSAAPLVTVDGLLVTVAASVAGGLIAHAARLPAASLLGPMLLTGALSLTGVLGGIQVPEALAQIAFAAIGLQVGLRFTPESLRSARDTLAPVLGAIALLMVCCAVLGWALSELAGVSLLDGYLATTPGGLYAVLATAVASGANATFVLAVQSLRLFLMVLAAPPIIRRLAVGVSSTRA